MGNRRPGWELLYCLTPCPKPWGWHTDPKGVGGPLNPATSTPSLPLLSEMDSTAWDHEAPGPLLPQFPWEEGQDGASGTTTEERVRQGGNRAGRYLFRPTFQSRPQGHSIV